MVLFKQQMQKSEMFAVSTVSIETTTGTFINKLFYLMTLKMPKGN